MKTTKVMFCGCAHAYQDQRYGAQLRLHNRTEAGSSQPIWRCTVCTTERERETQA